MSRTASLRVLIAGVGLAAFAGSHAQNERNSSGDDEVDRDAMNCISLPSIDHTEVIDDRTILFYERGSRVYRNYLPQECPGLEREKRFLYEVRSNRLCATDTVSVLEDWGVGVTRASHAGSALSCR